jgi:hypothetical protein
MSKRIDDAELAEIVTGEVWREASPLDKYRLATFGAVLPHGFWVLETRNGVAARGEPPTVHRSKVFATQAERDAYMAARGYI